MFLPHFKQIQQNMTVYTLFSCTNYAFTVLEPENQNSC